MIFKASSDFLDSVSFFLSKKGIRNNYHSCLIDLASELKDCTSNDIISKSTIIRQDESFYLLKMRVANSAAPIGKSGGYRVWLILDKNTDEVCFLEVYPKKGTAGKPDLTKEERASILENYIQKKNANSLKELDIKNAFSIQ